MVFWVFFIGLIIYNFNKFDEKTMIIDSPELRTTVNEIITAKLRFACSFVIFPQHKFYSSWNQYLIHREEKIDK